MPAGYSGTPLVKKLGYKPGFRCQVVHGPDHYAALVGERPEGCVDADRELDLCHAFYTDRALFESELPGLMAAIKVDGMIWISWPKKASKVPTTVNENVVRELALPLGLVDVKVCAVDEVWSGLKLVIRKERRAEVQAARSG